MNSNIFKKEFKREIYSLYVFLFIMLAYVFLTRSIIYTNVYDGMYYGTSLFIGIMLITMLIAGNIPTVIFNYLCSKEKLDLINSLPIKRKDMFNIKYFIGILYFTIPYVVGIIITLVLDYFKYPIPIQFSTEFLLLIIKYYLISIVIYTITTLCIIMTSKVLNGLILSGIFIASILSIPYVFLFISTTNMYINYYTYISFEEILYFKDLYSELYTNQQYIMQIGAILIFLLALYFLLIYLYKNRKVENVGDTLIFEKTRNPIIYFITIIITIPVTFTFYIILFNSEINNQMLDYIFIKFGVILFIVFNIVTYIISTIVYKKVKFNNVKKEIVLTNVICLLTFISIIFVAITINKTNYTFKADENNYLKFYVNVNSKVHDDTMYRGYDIEYIDSIYGVIGQEDIDTLNDLILEIIEETPKIKNAQDTYGTYLQLSVNGSGKSIDIYNIDTSYFEEFKQFNNTNIADELVVKDMLENEDNIGARIDMDLMGMYERVIFNKNELRNNYLYQTYYTYEKMKDINVDELVDILIYDIDNLNGYDDFDKINVGSINFDGDFYLGIPITYEYEQTIKALQDYQKENNAERYEGSTYDYFIYDYDDDYLELFDYLYELNGDRSEFNNSMIKNYQGRDLTNEELEEVYIYNKEVTEETFDKYDESDFILIGTYTYDGVLLGMTEENVKKYY